MKNRQAFNFLTSKAKKLGLYFSSSVHFALRAATAPVEVLESPAKIR